jgi:hypothetical protein
MRTVLEKILKQIGPLFDDSSVKHLVTVVAESVTIGTTSWRMFSFSKIMLSCGNR